MSRNAIIGLLLLFIFTFIVRIFGYNWDQSQHLHPDERFLTMVAQALTYPSTIGQYFDANQSGLNPHNVGHNFYVYGTWPILFVRMLADLLRMNSYESLTLVGRICSALIDSISGLFVFFISYSISKSIKTALFAAFLYATFALPIQLSHFFAVDPYATLASTIVVYLLVRKSYGLALGITLGFAFAAKISTFTILPTIALGFLFTMVKADSQSRFRYVVHILLSILIFCIFLLMLYPQLFVLGGAYGFVNQKILDNWLQLSSFNDPNGFFPPSVQWTPTTPIIYPLLNLVYIGIGLPSFFFVLAGIASLTKKIKEYTSIILLFFTISLFFYHGTQFVKALRYFYVLYPVMAVIGSLGYHAIQNTVSPKYTKPILFLSLIFILIWPVSVLSIYSKNHSRVAASEWIYNSIPTGSTITAETWDDALPLTLDNQRIHEQYTIIQLPVTGPETKEKWTDMQNLLNRADYLILTSNRGFGSMTGMPELFPKTTAYYNALFTESLGFIKIAEITSRPNIPIPGIQICIPLPGLTYGSIAKPTCSDSGISIDDFADETWTVYDHPKVLIYQKTGPVRLPFSIEEF